jgi:hypothetical protein
MIWVDFRRSVVSLIGVITSCGSSRKKYPEAVELYRMALPLSGQSLKFLVEGLTAGPAVM